MKIFMNKVYYKFLIFNSFHVFGYLFHDLFYNFLKVLINFVF